MMVLPQPLSPTIPTRSPGAMSKSILRVACHSPCDVLEADAQPRVPTSAPAARRRGHLCCARCAGCGRCHQPAARFFSFTSCSSISISLPMTLSRASRSSSALERPSRPPKTSSLYWPSVAAGVRTAYGEFVVRDKAARAADDGRHRRDRIPLLETARLEVRIVEQFHRMTDRAGRPRLLPANSAIASSGERVAVQAAIATSMRSFLGAAWPWGAAARPASAGSSRPIRWARAPATWRRR